MATKKQTKAKEQTVKRIRPKAVYPKLDIPKESKIVKARPDCEGVVYGRPTEIPHNEVKPPKPGTKRILIGVPLLAVTYEFFESFLKFWTELCVDKDARYEIGYHFAYRKPVHMAEEYLVDIARVNKCTHILLMDDDIYDVKKADLDKLIEADKDVIGGVMHASKFPHAMCVFRRYNKNRKVIDMPADDSMYRLYEVPCMCHKCGTGLSHWDMPHCPVCGENQDNMIQQADLIPFAFTLIKMSVFDKLKEPWFHCTNKYPTDSWFADRLEEAGLTEHAHMGVRLNHAGITDAFKAQFMQMGMEKARRDKKAIQLTPEQMDMHQSILLDKMYETELSGKAKPAFISKGKSTKPLTGRDTTLVTHGR